MEKLKAKIHCASKLNIDITKINNAAIVALRRLNKQGFEAYLVGGSIRDLMLGHVPKDFDISTQATPSQIRKIFPGSRIIGQRFKIVHVRIDGHLLEISTFRKSVKLYHTDHITGQILDDNVFGTIDEDATRRDFTINALYYDEINHTVLDFFNAIDDLRSRKLKLIGDPEKRFSEDPVRILRGVRFVSKFDLSVGDEIKDAIAVKKHLLNNVPPARRFDELMKLFYCGTSLRVWELLNEYDLITYLFAKFDINDELSTLSNKLTLLALTSTDARINEGKPVISAFMFCAILWPYYQHRFDQLLSKIKDPQVTMELASEEIISEQLVRTGMLRRITNTIREIWWLQYRLTRTRKVRVSKMLENQRFRAAYDFLLIRCEAGDIEKEFADFWTNVQTENPAAFHHPLKKTNKTTSNKRRKMHHLRLKMNAK